MFEHEIEQSLQKKLRPENNRWNSTGCLVNWRFSTEPSIGEVTLEIGQVETAGRAALAASHAASDWLCAWCLNHVAREKDRFCYEGRDEFIFSNPDGIRFEIITFSQTIGCRESGENFANISVDGFASDPIFREAPVALSISQ